MGLTGALFYMVLLAFGATITPGVGVGGSLLALLPQPVTEYSHAPAYALLTWLLTSSLRKRDWPQQTALWVSAVAAMVFGLWMEIFQGSIPGRAVEIGDVTSNAVGIGLSAVLIVSAAERRSYALTKQFLHFRIK
jgi:VanZ family protein